MISLFLTAASLATVYNDAAYADLAYARPASEGACEARFDDGSVEVTQAFNTDARTSINVAVVTGKTQQTFPAGTRLWVTTPFGPAWRALVLEGDGRTIRFVAHHRFVGDLLTSDWPSVTLQRSLDTPVADRVPITIATAGDGFRVKLAQALDCADSIGI